MVFFDYFVAQLPVVVSVCVAALLYRVATRGPVAWSALFAGLAVFLMYCQIMVLGLVLQNQIFGHATPANWFYWNWLGQTFSVVAVLLVITIAGSPAARAIGLQWRQRVGSLAPALMATATIVLVLGGGVGFVDGNGAHTNFSTIAYQATMPGLGEELFFRGVLLWIMQAAFDDRWNLANARVGPAAITVSVLFGALHGGHYIHGRFFVSAPLFILTAISSFMLVWLRQRTGSLVLPVMAHNATNVLDYSDQTIAAWIATLF